MATDLSEDSAKNCLQFSHSSMSKSRIIKNLLILSLGFVFLFSAFMALTNLQSSMNNDDSVGVASQSVIYSVAIISTLFLPTLLIKQFGCKVILVAGILTYSPYIAANFHPTMSTLLPTAILNGAGGVNLWTAASVYINQLSFIDAGGDTAKAELSTSRYFGILVMFIQTTQIWGNLVSFYVLRPSSSVSEIHQNVSANGSGDGVNKKISCGADFCGNIDQVLSPLPDRQRSTLIGIYFAFSIIAALVLLIFLDPLKQNDKEKNDGSSLSQNLPATFNQIKKTEQLLLVILTTFTGLEQGFVFADYSEAYVACSLGLQSVGLVFVCFGIVNAITAFTAGRLLKYVPRTVMMVSAAVCNIGVCVALLCWKPNIRHVSVFYILAYVACSLGLQSVGLVFVCFGIVNAITAFTAGRLLKYVPRAVMMVSAAVCNIGVCVALFCWKPNIRHVSVFYILVSFWGFSDAIWQTQLSALYGILFRNDEEAAFACYRLWEAIGFLIAFSCSGFLCTASKIYMQIGFLVAGMTGYIALEIRNFKKKN